MSTYEISKSSLLSLKAEILRKQEEVNKTKLQNKAKSVQESKKGTPLDLKNKNTEERSRRFDAEEDEDLLKKSKDTLEAKARLYDQLSQGKKRTGAERYLVSFGRKLTNARPPDDSDEDDYDRYPESEEENHLSDEYEPAKDPGDEWVEYVDCLGRTRRCLRRDLDHVKQKDSELKLTIMKSKGESGKGERDDETLKGTENRSDKIDEKGELSYNESSELLSSDMRTELLRRKWEKEEEELKGKSDIHYQDILFDEARVHGVGYYGFSRDEKERARQQEALNRLRKETEEQQKKADELKKLRDKQMAERLKAARNRRRARMGLPPEDDDANEPDATETEREEPPEPEKSQAEIELESKKEQIRKNHVRPWDIGKDGVKEHVELTQEQWVYKKRKERPNEFAPPSSYDGKDRTEKDKRKRIKNPYKTKEERDYKEPPRRREPSPINNECIDFDDEQDRLLNDYRRFENDGQEKRGKGVEIVPPSTFEYYGPSSGKKSNVVKKPNDLEESISAGLQYLRKQAEKKKRNRDDDMFL